MPTREPFEKSTRERAEQATRLAKTFTDRDTKADLHKFAAELNQQADHEEEEASKLGGP